MVAAWRCGGASISLRTCCSIPGVLRIYSSPQLPPPTPSFSVDPFYRFVVYSVPPPPPAGWFWWWATWFSVRRCGAYRRGRVAATLHTCRCRYAPRATLLRCLPSACSNILCHHAAPCWWFIYAFPGLLLFLFYGQPVPSGMDLPAGLGWRDRYSVRCHFMADTEHCSATTAFLAYAYARAGMFSNFTRYLPFKPCLVFGRPKRTCCRFLLVARLPLLRLDVRRSNCANTAVRVVHHLVPDVRVNHALPGSAVRRVLRCADSG